MLAIMHEGEPYSRLAVNGKPIPTEVLARMVGASTEEISDLLAELDGAGLIKRIRGGIIHSPRLAKERARSEKGRQSANMRWSQTHADKAEIASPSGSPTAKKQEVRTKKTDNREEPLGSSVGGRLSAQWQLPPEQRQWTLDRFPGVTESALELELEKFSSYWTAKDGVAAVKRDWDAAWRFWAINRWQSTVASAPTQKGWVRLHRQLHREIFDACERLRGKAVPAEEWSFPRELVQRAQAGLRGWDSVGKVDTFPEEGS